MAKLNDDVDALFRLPLAEFIGARKTLAARLKKEGSASEAEHVKALVKPSISAWTVNQLYWRQREAFDELIATGQRFRKAQASGKMVNMREALDARREALSQLSDLATEILREAGHNPSLDTLRRIATTLEALSALATSADGPTPGRLTQDIDPPGFDSFGSFVPVPGVTKRGAERLEPSPSKTVTAVSNSQQKAAEVSRRKEERQLRINAAKVSLQHARKSLTAARATARSLEAAHRKAADAAKEALKEKRAAEERFEKARAQSEDASERAQSIAVEFRAATEALAEAKRDVEKATRELETSFRQSPRA
jgi:hypothetical protein